MKKRKRYYDPHKEKVRNNILENQRVHYLSKAKKKNDALIIFMLFFIITILLTER